MRTSKVALISPVYPYPRAGFFPGVERYVHGLSRALAERDVEVKLITSFWNGGVKHENLNDVEICRVKDLSVKLGRLGRLFDLHYHTLGKNIFKHCKDIISSSDIVHTLMPLSYAKEVRKLKPLVSHFHHPVGIEKPSDLLHIPFHHRIEKNTYMASDIVITHSNYMKNLVSEKFNISESKIEVIYPGVDIKFLAPRKRSGNQDKIRLLFIGTLERRKGVEYLIHAMKHILERCSNVELNVVGSGPEKLRLKRLVKTLRVETYVNFVEVPYVGEEKLPSYYNNADIFVFPSLMEGFGLVVAEAMGCGLPIVAANTTSIPEVVGDAGMLVEPRNPVAIGEAVLKLVESSELRVKIGRKAKVRIEENFTWDKAADDVSKAYMRAMAVHPKD